MWRNFAANGFVALYLNPRGSTSYGRGFVDGIDHNYRGPDFDDLMSGADALVAKGFVDQARMYVSGCSGGGGRPLPGDRLDQHVRRDRRAAVRLKLLRQALPGGPQALARAFVADVRGQG